MEDRINLATLLRLHVISGPEAHIEEHPGYLAGSRCVSAKHAQIRLREGGQDKTMYKARWNLRNVRIKEDGSFPRQHVSRLRVCRSAEGALTLKLVDLIEVK